MGRFISADTIVPEPGNPQALNRYAYVLNNPLRYTDPTGHLPCPLCKEVKNAVGDVVSAGGSGVRAGWNWSRSRVGWMYRSSRNYLRDSWTFVRRQSSQTADQIVRGATSVARASAGAASTAGSAGVSAAGFVADYQADRTADTVTLVGLTIAKPDTAPQNLVAATISTFSWGDRRQGKFGFALYENCKGLCQLGWALGANDVPYTPGYLGFASSTVEQEDFDHENQHAVQSLVTGYAYLPLTVGFYASCGFQDPCMHDRSPFEQDAKKAETDGVHYPDFLLP